MVFHTAASFRENYKGGNIGTNCIPLTSWERRTFSKPVIRLGGKRGERYLAAGRTITMEALFKELERVSGIRGPRNKVPMAVVFLLGAIGELRARITRQPALVGWANVQLLVKEARRQHFDHQKSERELGIWFREIQETLRDAIGWFKANGYA